MAFTNTLVSAIEPSVIPSFAVLFFNAVLFFSRRFEWPKSEVAVPTV
jgi:hypothetical protein